MIADYIYHFMPLHRSGREKEDLEHVKSAILHAEYFFGSPLDFNDPFDCKPNFRTKIKDSVNRKTLQNQLQENLERAGIFCLAEELYNTLMWSHYANSHKCIALQFSTQQIRMGIDGIGIMDKVTYHNELPTINPWEADKLKQMMGIIFRKSKRWTFENEVRIVLLEVISRTLKLPKMPVRNIYFGCKIDANDESELIQVCQGRTNSIYRLQMSSTQYAYKRKPVKVCGVA